MWKVYQPCILLHQLTKSLHPHDTLMNESMNQVVSKYAPKHKLLGTTMASVSTTLVTTNSARKSQRNLKLTNCQCFIVTCWPRPWTNNRKYQSKPEVKRKRNWDTLKNTKRHQETQGRRGERGYIWNMNGYEVLNPSRSQNNLSSKERRNKYQMHINGML